MSVRMRHTRGHSGNRRSHHALAEPRLSTCAQCKKTHLRHRVCMHCGMYRGKTVIDVSKRDARTERRRIAKLKEIGAYKGKESLKAEGHDHEHDHEHAHADTSNTPLDASSLSSKPAHSDTARR